MHIIRDYYRAYFHQRNNKEHSPSFSLASLASPYLYLVLGVVGPGVRNILKAGLRVHAEALCNLLEALGAEGTLGIDVDGLALGAAVGDGHLAGYAESMAELGLSSPELAKGLCKGSSLDASLQELVELDGPGSKLHHVLSVLKGVSGSLEVHGDKCTAQVLELVDLRRGVRGGWVGGGGS